jgi:hypothetical protein
MLMMLRVHREIDTRSFIGLAGLETVGWIYDTKAAHEKDSLTLLAMMRLSASSTGHQVIVPCSKPAVEVSSI